MKIPNKIKILLLFFRTINDYGYLNSMKILFYELYYTFFLFDFITLKFDDEQTSSYTKSKNNGKYDVPYIPTPYYLLHLIKKFLLEENIKKINLIDIGCGYCRPEKFLSKKIETTFYGIELNKKIITSINKDRTKKLKIQNFNIRNLNKIKIFFNKCLSKSFVNLIFISDTVEVGLINKLLKKLNKKCNIYLVMINIKYKHLDNKIFKIQRKILFKNSSRNIIFLNNIPRKTVDNNFYFK